MNMGRMLLDPRSLVILTTLLLTLSAFAGERVRRAVERGDELYERHVYSAAIRSYLHAVKLGARNEHVSRRLGHSYLMLGNARAAEPWFSDLVKYLGCTEEDVLTYGEVLKALERYEDHEDLICGYYCDREPDAWAEHRSMMAQVRSLRSRSSNFVVKNLAINTEADEFSPAWHGNGHVLFSSSRPRTVKLPVLDGWTGEPFTCLYVADRSSTGDLAEPRILVGLFDNWSNQGPATVASDGTMYYSRNGRKERNGQADLEIHRAVHKGGINWQADGHVVLPGWTGSAFHPSLSPTGRTMVFASDNGTGPGGTDLYITHLERGQWTVPVPLSGAVNSPANEVFPFFGPDGDLYFSSNGHVGMGGYDIYRAKADGKGGFGEPMNLGMPVNSSSDDLGFIIDRSGNNGYFTSNRPGGMGGDDLYSFRLAGPMVDMPYLLEGTVFTQEGRPFRYGLVVELLNELGEVLDSTYTDTKGRYSFEIDPRGDLLIRARASNYLAPTQHVAATPGAQRAIVRDLVLMSSAELWVAGTVIGRDSRKPPADVEITVLNNSTYQTSTQKLGFFGGFVQQLQPGEPYSIILSAPGYFTQELPITSGEQQKGLIDLGLNKALELEPWDPKELFILPVDGPAVERTVERIAERMQWHTRAVIEFTANNAHTQKAAYLLVTAGIAKERIRFADDNDAGGSTFRLLKNDTPGGAFR
jgi:hypothetical protein